MAQNGFALFFVVVLIGCVFALAAWVRANWARIAAAARAEVPGDKIMNYKASQCRPIDVPYVAQRMLPQGQAAPRPRTGAPAVWNLRKAAPAGCQLRFGF